MTDVLKISKTFQALSKFSPRRCCTKHDVENKIMKQSFMCHLHVLGLTSNISCIDLKSYVLWRGECECRLCEVRLVFFFVSPRHFFFNWQDRFQSFFNNVSARLQTMRGSDVIL